MQFTEELKNKLLKTSPAQIGHYIQGGYMSPKIKPVFETAKAAGPAFTVRLTSNDSVLLYYAMERAPKGSIIVIDRGGDETFACCGEIVVNAAKYLGMAGIVIDGPATDSIAIKELNFPVWCTGISPVTTRFLGVSGEYDIPVNCGGAVVNPGDIIFGDADGVICLKTEDVEKYVDIAIADDEEEIEWKEKMAQGIKVSELCNIDRLVEQGVKSRIGELLAFDE